MARWSPDARGRLREAAMALFQKRGYLETTVEDIAARAGLTERTFFRHFADKREVLFSGSEELHATIVASIAAAPRDATPFDVVVGAMEVASASLEAGVDLRMARARWALVLKHAEIQERELIKMAGLGAAVRAALGARGVAEPAASLAAEAGMAVFKVGFERWIEEKAPGDFASHVRAAATAMRGVAAAPKKTARRDRG